MNFRPKILYDRARRSALSQLPLRTPDQGPPPVIRSPTIWCLEYWCIKFFC